MLNLKMSTIRETIFVFLVTFEIKKDKTTLKKKKIELSKL